MKLNKYKEFFTSGPPTKSPSMSTKGETNIFHIDAGDYAFDDKDKFFGEMDKHTFMKDDYKECNCSFDGYYAATNYVVRGTGKLRDKRTELPKYCKHFKEYEQ